MGREKSSYNRYGDLFPIVMGGDAVADPSNRLFYYYSNLAMNRFRWEGLPEGIESRSIEEQLFFHGMVFFTDDEEYGLICLKASPMGWDIYKSPTELRVMGFQYSKEFNINQGVLIRENDMEYPPFLHLLHYINIVNEIDQTVTMNLGQQRFPVILPKTAHTKLSVDRVADKMFNEYFPMQVVDERLEKAMGENLEKIKALKTDVPFLLDKLQDFKHDKESELYTYLGLNNANTDKRERLITSEVEANNGQVMMSLDLGYKCRKAAAEIINQKYGLNVKVIKVVDELHQEEMPKEGEENDNSSEEV